MEAPQRSMDLDLAIELEERAHRLRMAILNDREFMAGVLEGYEAAQRGETISLEELDREFDWT